MAEVRAARVSDLDGIRELWRICFEDSENFMDWFFRERFFPEYSSCVLEDGVVVSAMQCCPLHINIRNTVIPALMLAGVSTHPSSRGKGYMRQGFSLIMQIARNAGFPVVIHTPQNIKTFQTFGHLPATNTMWCTINNAHSELLPDGVYAHLMYEGLASLHAIYNKFSQAYSGSVSRSVADFYYKFRDYTSDGGKCLCFEDSARLRGYCVYYALDDKLHAEECVFDNETTLNKLIKALAYEADGRRIHIKLPNDASVSFPDSSLEIRPQGVMGIADVPALLSAILGRSEFVFRITDGTVSENNGTWTGAGTETNRPPQITLDVGSLAQFLCGYRSIDELTGAIETHDQEAAKALDALLPKKTCFIVDEY